MAKQVRDNDQTVWEGTWEEIAAHADAFAGRRFRLTALEGAGASAEPDGETLDMLLAPLLEEARLLQRDENPPTPTDPHEIAFGEAVKEKAKRLGFKL